MSASKVLDLAERQGLLDTKAIGELRKQVAESKFVVTPEAVAKILVDKGQLTAFQARRLVASALEEPEGTGTAASAPPPPAEKTSVKKPVADDDLFLADAPPPSSPPSPTASETARPPAKPPAAKPAPPKSQVEAAPPPPKAAPPKPKAAPPRSRSAPPPPPLMDAGLTPLEGGLAPLGGGLTPLGDALTPLAGTDTLTPLGSAEPLSPLHPLAEPKSAPLPPKKPKRANSYSLILMLSSALGICFLVFVPLAVWFVYGNTADLFKKAEQEYNDGALSSAMEKYDKFLQSGATGPEASTAQVKKRMAEIRQVSSEGKNPRPGLQAAQRLLPEMEQEESFNLVRVELRTLLVDVARSFAAQAVAAKETAKREELVGLTEDAMKLVDNPAYIPANLKAEVQPLLSEVSDRLKAARRSIDQDKELVKSLAGIKTAVEKGDAVGAYKIRLDLLKAFPAVEADSALAEATRSIGEMEQKRVKIERASLASSTDDAAPPDTRVILATHEGQSTLDGSAVLLLEGALYGLDAKNGKVNWRRFVGYETMIHPVPLSRDKNADVLAVDARKHELLRLSSSTGKLVWRHVVGKPFAMPTIGADKIYVTTSEGHILEIDAAMGKSELQAILPQKPHVALAADTSSGKLYQPGEHSTLFVLEADGMQCKQTIHVGHRPHAIAVPPVAVLSHLLIVENPSDDYAVVHMFAPQGGGKGLAELPEPLRLKGRVVMPMAVDRNRIVIVTDLGQITVLQVDSSNKARPIRQVGASEAIEKSPVLTYFAVDAGMIYAAGNRISGYEIQGSQQKLGRKWTLATGDAFVAPPLVMEGTVIHARKRLGSLATTVSATAAGGNELWSADLAAPLAALFPNEARKQIVAVTSRGRTFEIPADALASGSLDTPAFIPLAGTESMSLTDGVQLLPDKWACLGMKSSGHFLTYDNSAANFRTKHFEVKLNADRASAPSVAFRGGAVVPLRSGQIKLINPTTGGDLALPFQPALQASQRLNWRTPAVFSADGSVLAISDGANTIYRLTVKNEPQPHLESLGETVVEHDVVAPLAISGDTLYAVGHSPTTDILYSFQGVDLQSGPKKNLQGRVQFGPAAAGGAVFLADDKSLYCCESAGKIRWTIPLTHGTPSAPPIPHGQDFIVITKTGAVYRVSQEKGNETGIVELGEPLTAPATLLNEQVLAAGSDGTIHLIPLPAKP